MKKTFFDRCATIDDGCNPKLVKGAEFEGIMEIPIIKAPIRIVIPPALTPFTKRNRIKNMKEMICFNEMDQNFSEILINPDAYIEDFKRFGGIVSLDCSLYRNAPLSVQVTNIYKSRAIGSYYQRKGIYVIPFVRWGNRYTYSTEYFPEKIAFLGVEKNSIVAIGTYGCINSKEDKINFKEGLKEMIQTLTPKVVLVYGSMPQTVFSDFENKTKFVQYDNWTFRVHKKENNKNGK